MIKILSLCPSCTACPAVQIDDQEVRIGEDGNYVRLTPAEWNVLVEAIKTGALDTVEIQDR